MPLTGLSPEEEAIFQMEVRAHPWFEGFVSQYGEEPNLNDPNYDYRGAWKANAMPQPSEYDDGRYHWTSQFKSENHPTMWKEHFMRTTGQDPDAVGVNRIEGERMMRGWSDQYRQDTPSVMQKTQEMFGVPEIQGKSDFFQSELIPYLNKRPDIFTQGAEYWYPQLVKSLGPGPMETLERGYRPDVEQIWEDPFMNALMPENIAFKASYIGPKSQLWKKGPQIGANEPILMDIGWREPIKVYKNPTDEQMYSILDRFESEHPSAPLGEPKTRSTYDTEGNRYVWMSSDAMHEPVENYLKSRYGVISNQNSDIPEVWNVSKAKIPETYPEGAFSSLYDRALMKEISDEGAKLKPTIREPTKTENEWVIPGSGLKVGEGKLSDILEHPQLFSLYPKLNEIDVKVSIIPWEKKPYAEYQPIGTGTAKDAPRITVVAKNEEQAKEKLLHEITHHIQEEQRWASGGTIAMRGPNYKNLLGEIQARDAAARMGLKQEQLTTNPPLHPLAGQGGLAPDARWGPLSTENIPIEDAIIRKGGSGKAMSEPILRPGDVETPEFKAWSGGAPVVEDASAHEFQTGKPVVVRGYHGTQAKEDFTEFSTTGVVRPESEFEEFSSGSGYDPTAFLGAHFAAEPSVANKFALGTGWMKGRYEPDAKPRVIPVYTKFKKPYNFGHEQNMRDYIYEGKINDEDLLGRAVEADGLDPFDFDSPEVKKWFQRYKNDKKFRIEQNKYIFESYRPEEGEFDFLTDVAESLGNDARERLIAEGYDGAIYKNMVEGGTSFVVFDPTQIKSVFNRGTWNPKNPDILKMLPPLVGAGSLAALYDEAEAREKAKGETNVYQEIQDLMNRLK